MRVNVSQTGMTLPELVHRLLSFHERGPALLACEAATIMAEESPVDTGRLRSHIGIYYGGPGWGGAAPIDEMGDPKRPAPRGTISDFLYWWRETHGG